MEGPRTRNARYSRTFSEDDRDKLVSSQRTRIDSRSKAHLRNSLHRNLIHGLVFIILSYFLYCQSYDAIEKASQKSVASQNLTQIHDTVRNMTTLSDIASLGNNTRDIVFRDFQILSISLFHFDPDIQTSPSTEKTTETRKTVTICRIPSVCVASHQTLLFPSYMKQWEVKIRYICKVPLFRILDIHEDMYEESSMFSKFFTSSSANGPQRNQEDINFQGNGRESWQNEAEMRDLMGINIIRDHMPHFLQDILPHLISMNLLLHAAGDESEDLKTSDINVEIEKKCLVPKDDTLGSCPERYSNDDSQEGNPPFYILNPTFPVCSNFYKGTPEWVFSFFNGLRLPQRFGNKDTVISPTAIELDKAYIAETPTCFRSFIMVSYPNPFVDTYRRLLKPSNFFFKENGIDRNPKNVGTVLDNSDVQRSCSKLITVLNRKGFRSLMGIKKLQSDLHTAVTDMVQKEFLQKHGISKPNITLSITEFSESSYDQQIKIMQSTDIFISPHGAGNANYIFLRENTPVLEIFPFGYDPDIYEFLSSILRLDYSSMIALPDDKTFIDCAKELIGSDSSPKADERFGKVNLDQVISDWQKAAQQQKEWRTRPDFKELYHSLEESTKRHELEVSHLEYFKVSSSVKRCMRRQKLHFDRGVVVDYILHNYVNLCNVARKIPVIMDLLEKNLDSSSLNLNSD